MSQQPTSAVTKQQPSQREMEFIPFGSADSIKLNVEIVKNLIAVPTKSGQTCSDRDAIKFMMLCKAQKLNPFAGDAFLIGYDSRDGATFSLITAHVAFLKRAETRPEFDGMKSGIIVVDSEDRLYDIEGDFHLPSQKVVGGWATVYFKNRKHPITRRVRLQRFQKSFGVWQDDPAGMICKVAEADALRSSFPTLIGGLYMRDEINPDEPGTVIEMVSSTRQSKPDLSLPEPKAATSKETPKPEPKPEPALVEEAKTETAPEPKPEATTPDATPEAGSPQANLLEFLEANGVAPELFRNYITVNGITRKHGHDVEKLDVADWPEDLCNKLQADAAMMARVVQKFGKK